MTRQSLPLASLAVAAVAWCFTVSRPLRRLPKLWKLCVKTDRIGIHRLTFHRVCVLNSNKSKPNYFHLPQPRRNLESIRAAVDTWAADLRPGQLQVQRSFVYKARPWKRSKSCSDIQIWEPHRTAKCTTSRRCISIQRDRDKVMVVGFVEAEDNLKTSGCIETLRRWLEWKSQKGLALTMASLGRSPPAQIHTLVVLARCGKHQQRKYRGEVLTTWPIWLGAKHVLC